MNITRSRIIAALKTGARSVSTLETIAFTSQRNALHHIKCLKDEGLIHISSWRRGATGPFRPVYSWGPGVDAVKPVPVTRAESCRKYRANLRAKHGDNYDLVRKAQKKHIPGRQVVVDGKVIYQQ